MSDKKPPKKLPMWILNDNWGVSIDPYNWILVRKHTEHWRNKGYYPSPELLLKDLRLKLLRTEPLDEDLIRHVEMATEAAETLSRTFLSMLHDEGLGAEKITPQKLFAHLKTVRPSTT